MDNLVTKACQIIFANEGNYGSVNKNDNGAVSIGKVQWHGNRARNLLKMIDIKLCQSFLTFNLISELLLENDWSKRVVTEIEALTISHLLKTPQGKEAQDRLAEKDISSYIRHIQGLGVTDDNSIILLADIENQGGSVASERIIKATRITTADPLDSYMKSALNDRVFSKYQERRMKVYNKLTGRHYDSEIKAPLPSGGYATYIVKRGDTLSGIGRKYSVDWRKIAEYNGIKSPYTIYENQVIKIVK